MALQQFTRADISSALSRLFTLPPDHEGLARLSGMLEKAVNETPEFRRSGLEGAAFASLAFMAAPGELKLDVADPAHVQRERAEKANIYSAEGIAAQAALEAAQARRGGEISSTGATKTSARFDGIVEGTRTANKWDTDAGRSEMRALAIERGVPWVGNVPDILRLGPAAVQAIADVQLRQESYNRLTKDASFSAKDVVTLSKFAKEKGIDANKLSGEVADGVKALAGDDRRQREELAKAISGYMAKPDDEGAKTRLNELLDRHGKDPKKKDQADKLRERLQLQQKKEQGAAVKADVKDQGADAVQNTAAAARVAAQNADDATAALLEGGTQPTAPVRKGEPATPPETRHAEPGRPVNDGQKTKVATASPAPGK